MQSDNNEKPSRELHIYAILVILIVTTLPYLNSFQGVFDFDDVFHITENPIIRIQDLSWSSIEPIFREGPSRQRWLPMLSIAVNYYFSGYEVFGYHLFNLVVHLLTALLLYHFFCLLLKYSGERQSDRRIIEISLFAVLLWAVHPVQTNGVTYVIQRMASMAAMFSVAACICYMKGRFSIHQTRRWVWWICAVFLWLLALSSKENSAILPLVILGLDFYYFRRSGESYKNHLIFLGFVITAGLMVAVLFLGTNAFGMLQEKFAELHFTVGERLLTQAVIVFYYISLLILPLPSRLNLCYDFPVSHSLVDPPWTLAAVIGVFALIWLIFYLYRKHRLLSFALFWFLANLLIESSIFPIELIYEHRLYLPSMLLFLALVTYAYRLPEIRVPGIRFCIIVACLFLAVGTWQRNKVWTSVENLWTDVLKKSPGITRAYTNLGRVYNRQGKYDKAMAILRKGLEIDQQNGLIWLNIGYIHMMQDQFDAAVSAYSAALNDSRIGLNEYKVRTALAFAYLKKNEISLALTQAEHSLKLNPRFPNTWVFKGMAYGQLGEHEKALESGRRAIAADPGFTEGYLLVARALDHMGQTREALGVLNQAQMIKGNTPGIANFRGYLNQKLNAAGR